MGGTAATVTPEACLRQGADYAIAGEGEEAFVELINTLANGSDPSGMANLWHQSPSGPKGNRCRPLIADLDSLPIPDLEDAGKFVIRRGKLTEGEPMREFTRYETITSRGCPYKCAFCTNSFLHKLYSEDASPFVRQRSVAHVIRELEYVKRRLPKMSAIFFADEVFAERLEWLREFVEPYRTRIAVPFECATDPRVVSEEQLSLMKKAGVAEVNIGIQAGTERVRHDLFQRFSSDAQIATAARLINEQGILARYDIITDNPFETEEDKKAALELLLRLPHPWVLNLYHLHYFPNTVLTRMALEKGIVTESAVSGENDECLRQFTVSFDFPRAKADQTWAALYMMTSKAFVPRSLLRWIAGRKCFFRHPLPVMVLARTTSLTRLMIDGMHMLFTGRIDLKFVIRYLRSIRYVNR